MSAFAQNADPSVQDFLGAVRSNFGSVVNAVPDRYAMTEGDTGVQIGDGGGDMFDGGNILTTNVNSDPIPYTNGAVQQAAQLGGGNYFTLKVNNVFVFAGENNGAEWFKIHSDYGSDGRGNSAIDTFTYGGYTGYNLRIFGAGDPSVNKLIIVRTSGGIGRQENTSTAAGFVKATGLGNTSRIYYMLYGAASGREVNTAETQNIFQNFVDIINSLSGQRPAPCVELFSECNFQGDSISVCGSHPTIPDELRNFRINSVRVPEGVQVTFFRQANFEEERLRTREHLECLDNPFNLSFMQVQHQLGRRQDLGQVLNSMRVHTIEE